MTDKTRAGLYVQQSTGYRAFIPAPLPPQPPVHLAGNLQKSLSQADRALGRLDGSIQILPNPDLFVFMYVRKEAVLSSQIEGAQSSIQDVLAAEAQIFAPDRPQDVNEVINYVQAMNYGLERLAHLPISIRLIKEIHAKLLAGVRGAQLTPGELRRSQNWIGPGGCTLADAAFVPPPPHKILNALGDEGENLYSFTAGSSNVWITFKCTMDFVATSCLKELVVPIFSRQSVPREIRASDFCAQLAYRLPHPFDERHIPVARVEQQRAR